MNKVMLIGNLTKDPEVTTTSSSISVCRLSLAVSRTFTSKDGKDVDYIPVVVWRQTADNCAKFLKKGSKCAVAGRIQTRSYEGQDGVSRTAFEVVADEVQFLSTKASEDNGLDGFDDLKPVDDDLPF